MSILLDGIVVVLFIVTCITGYVMGFFKYAALMLKTVATLLIAALAAYIFAAPAYNAVARDKAVSTIEQKIEKIDVIKAIDDDLRQKGLPQGVTQSDLRQVMLSDGDVVESFNRLLQSKGVSEKDRQKITQEFENYLDSELFGRIIRLSGDGDKDGESSIIKIGLENTRAELVKLVKILVAGDKHSAAQEIEEHYVRPFGVKVAGAILFLLVSIAVSIIFVIVIKVAGVLSKIKAVSAANSFGGLALGAAKGAVYVLVIAYVLCMVVNSSKNGLDNLNTGIIDKTYLFKHFFNIFYK